MPASSTAAAGSSWPRHGPPARASGWATTSVGSWSRAARRWIATASPDSRRRRRVTVFLAAAAVVAITLAGIAFVQRRNADRQADERRAGELAGLATLAIDEDPERAILLGLAALERTDEPSAEVLSALHRATQSMRLTSRVDGVMSLSMDQSPDGRCSPSTAWTEPATCSSTLHPARPSPTSRRAPRSAISGSRSIRPAPRWPSPIENFEDESAPAVELFDVASSRTRGIAHGSRRLLLLSRPVRPDGSLAGGARGRCRRPAERRGVGRRRWRCSAVRSSLPTTSSSAATAPSIIVGNGTGLTVFDIATGQQLRQIDTPTGVEYWDFEVDPTGKLAALVSTLGGARRRHRHGDR